jgi:toxin ParE1/3/4
MSLRLSRLAMEDIAQIHDYTVRKWGDQQALKYMHRLWDALEEIAAPPERWRERPRIYPGCRARVSGSHLIIYRVRDGLVEVSRILHGAMDASSHVPPGFMGKVV